MTGIEIYKLQRPIVSSSIEERYEILAYTAEEGKSLIYVHLNPKQIKQLFGSKYKVYVKAELRDSQLFIHSEALQEEFDW